MKKSSQNVHLENLGQKTFQEAWDYQESLFKRIVDRKIEIRKSGKDLPAPDNYLLFVQHNHVYTLGKSGDPKNLLLNEEELNRRRIDYYKINRGGDITYHGPGQIVVYPILDLDQFFTDIHRYLRTLEEAVIQTMKEYGLEGGRIDGLTGVWLDFDDMEKARKICALGVRASRWVTMHGLAFNINTDLSYFKNIVPCGIDDKDVTSMERELGRKLDQFEVSQILLSHLSKLFGWNLIS